MKKQLLGSIKKFILKVDEVFKNSIASIFKTQSLNRLLKRQNFSNLPIYIISFNRLDYLKQTITWMERFGFNRIIIIDNASTYQPLLDYYNICNHKIIYMKKNWGHMVFFKAPRFIIRRNFSYFVLTDPDLMPIEFCKPDVLEQFAKVLCHYPCYSKVGFSLKIDDIPDAYYLKDEVIAWESRFYSERLPSTKFDFDLYKANIDTTFALYCPLIFRPYKDLYKGIRTGFPYQARHLPWYILKSSKEDANYVSTIRKDVSNWNGNVSKEQMKKRIIKHSDSTMEK